MKVTYMKDIIQFLNSYGFYSKEIKNLGLPVRTFYYSHKHIWLNVENLEEDLYLVSQTTAKKIKEPVSYDEPIYGFTRVQNGFAPLYNRPSAREKIDKGYIYEIEV